MTSKFLHQRGFSGFETMVLLIVITAFGFVLFSILKSESEGKRVLEVAFKTGDRDIVDVAIPYKRCMHEVGDYTVCKEQMIIGAANSYLAKDKVMLALSTTGLTEASESAAVAEMYDKYFQLAIDRFNATVREQKDICKTCSDEQLVLAAGNKMLLSTEAIKRVGLLTKML